MQGSKLAALEQDIGVLRNKVTFKRPHAQMQ